MLCYLAIETFLAVLSDTGYRFDRGVAWYDALAYAVGNAFVLWTVLYIVWEILGWSTAFEQIDYQARDFLGRRQS